MAKMTGAQYLADAFDGYGVTHVFLVPAILQATLAAIEERTSIDRIIAHSEKAAVYMADGYARASGRPASPSPKPSAPRTSPPPSATPTSPAHR